MLFGLIDGIMTHFAEYKEELSTSQLFKGGWTSSRMGLLLGMDWVSLWCGCFGEDSGNVRKLGSGDFGGSF